jgi:hypothetical protein
MSHARRVSRLVMPQITRGAVPWILVSVLGLSCSERENERFDGQPNEEPYPAVVHRGTMQTDPVRPTVTDKWIETVPPEVLSIVEESDFQHVETVRMQCRSETLVRALDNLLIIADLWTVYGFTPEYKVVMNADGFHVTDSTGLRGAVELVYEDEGTRVYHAIGRLDHWAVPAFNEGDAVFALQFVEDGQQTTAQVAVYLKAGGDLAGALVEVVKPILKTRVQNRLLLNVEDLNRILYSIQADPEAVYSRLSNSSIHEFIEGREEEFRRIFVEGAAAMP